MTNFAAVSPTEKNIYKAITTRIQCNTETVKNKLLQFLQRVRIARKLQEICLSVRLSVRHIPVFCPGE